MKQCDELRQRMNAAMVKTQEKEQKSRGLGRYPAYQTRTPPLVFNCVAFTRIASGRSADLEAAGFSTGTIADWRAGTSRPVTSSVRKLAKALGCPVSALMAPLGDVYEW